MTHPICQTVIRAADAAQPDAPACDPCDHVALDYEDRMMRRRVLTGTGGTRFLVDLPRSTALDHGDLLELADGRRVQVMAAEEPLMDVRGDDLARLAWHVGNRHAPCRIEAGRLVIRHDKVLAAMLLGLGATLAERVGPFDPEGGAYGPGRVQGHHHGPHGHTREATGHETHGDGHELHGHSHSLHGRDPQDRNAQGPGMQEQDLRHGSHDGRHAKERERGQDPETDPEDRPHGPRRDGVNHAPAAQPFGRGHRAAQEQGALVEEPQERVDATADAVGAAYNLASSASDRAVGAPKADAPTQGPSRWAEPMAGRADG